MLIGARKLDGVAPRARLAGALDRIDADHPESRIDELMPWVALDA